jgi:hypothetical protein
VGVLESDLCCFACLEQGGRMRWPNTKARMEAFGEAGAGLRSVRGCMVREAERVARTTRL